MIETLLAAGQREDRWVTCADRRWSLAQLIDRAQRLQLPEFSPQERVALIASTSLEMVAVIVAIWLRGGVPVCLPPAPRLGRGPDLASLTAASQSRYLLEKPDFPLGEPVPVVPGTPEDLALVQFSSGTTLAPRPVGLTQANLLSNTRTILSLFPGRPEEHSCVSWLPLYHDMGSIGSLLTALVAQGDLTLLKPAEFAARPGRWLQTLSQTKATVSPAPNFALVHCLERAPIEELDLSHWRLALLGGETISAVTLERFHQRFAPCGLRWEALTPVYGLAEATLAVTFSPPGRGPRILEHEGRRLVSVGRPLPGLEVEIRDRRVHVRGPSVMRGYLGHPPHDGWLDTG